MKNLMIYALLFVACMWGGWALSSAQCAMRWPAQLRPELHVFVGCTVEVNGLRIPETAFRVV